MEGFLIRAAVVAIGLWLASKMGLVAFNSTGTLIAAALLLGVVNAFVRPIIIILTLPITLLTLGLFLLVINALMIMLDPEAAVEAHLGTAILVHARRLEDGRHRVTRRKRDSGGIGFGGVKKDRRAGRTSEQA